LRVAPGVVEEVEGIEGVGEVEVEVEAEVVKVVGMVPIGAWAGEGVEAEEEGMAGTGEREGLPVRGGRKEVEEEVVEEVGATIDEEVEGADEEVRVEAAAAEVGAVEVAGVVAAMAVAGRTRT
jgi:hypothetical protein